MSEIYSLNKLKSGEADTAVLTDWTSTGLTVVDGGPDELSTKTFALAGGGNMSQKITAKGLQPPDYKINGTYIPGKKKDDNDIKLKAFIKVVVEYGDGTKDIISIPIQEELKL